MDNGEADETVTLRRDMRNPTGGLLLAVLGIASPDSGGVSDLEAVPNPVIWSGQILDPGRDVKRFEVRTEVLKQGRQMAYSRSTIVDADNPNRVLALTEGPGRQHRRAARGAAEDGAHPPRDRRLPRPAAAVAGVRRRLPTRRALGTARTVGRSRLARCRAAHRPAVRHPRDRGVRRRMRRGGHRPTAGHVVARDVPCPREGRARSVSRRNRSSAPTARSPRGRCCTTKATGTRRSPRRPTSSQHPVTESRKGPGCPPGGLKFHL